MEKLYKNNNIPIKLYWLISLLYNIKKTLESIFTKEINFVAKIYHLLLKTYFEGKKNTLTKYIIYYLIEKVYII